MAYQAFISTTSKDYKHGRTNRFDMKIYKKTLLIEKPKKILGLRMIFPITSYGQLSVDNSLFGDEFCIEEIVLVVRVKEKKFKGVGK